MALHLGIRYVYGETVASTDSDMSETLRSEDLATLPATLRDELEKAVMSLDSGRVTLIIKQISEQNASLGRVLGRLAERLAYSPILTALRSGTSKSTEADACRS
jgi:hypothetical protein